MRSLHLYRRGARWWYRTSAAAPSGKRLDLRLPIGPMPFSFANDVARLLDADVTRIVASGFEMFGKKRAAPIEPPVLPTDEDLYAAMRTHLKARMRYYLGRHAGREDSSNFALRRRENLRDIDLLSMILETGTTRASANRHRVAEYLAELRESGMDPDRLDQLRSAWEECARRDDGYPVPAQTRDALYRDTGRSFDADALARLDRLLLEAEREAAWRSELRRREMARMFDVGLPGDDEGRPFSRFPHLPMTAAEEQALADPSAAAASAQASEPTEETFAPPPVAQGPGASVATDEPAKASAWSEKTVGEIAALLVASKEVDGAKWSGTAPTATMIKLLQHAIGGDRPYSELTQEHLGSFRDLMARMPTRWGRQLADQLGGVPAALQRATTLAPDAVGLSGATIAKHLSYLKTFLVFAESRGAKPGEPLNLQVLQKEARTQKTAEKKQYGRGRDNWEPAEVKILLNTPAFTGSAGPKRSQRHRPGTMRYHDADYWMLLCLIHTGARSSELAGLRLDDVLDAEPIPLIEVRDDENRGVKTTAGKRRIPVHPELIRLGFFDYVRALRAAGAVDLFPELRPGGNQSWSSVYMKHFVYLRRAAFPKGTKGSARLKGANKEKDVHGLRGTFVTCLVGISDAIVQQLIGHQGAKETKVTRGYLSKELLAEMLEAMKLTTHLTADLKPVPVVLNPVALRRKAAKQPKMVRRPPVRANARARTSRREVAADEVGVS